MNRQTLCHFAALTLVLSACGDGVFDLSFGAQTSQQELRPDGKGGGGKSDKNYNCKRDKGVDIAAQIDSANARSPMQLALSASGQTDDSGTAEIAFFRVEDEFGNVQTVTPKTSQACPLARVDDATDFTIEPLDPGVRYEVIVVTRDLCGNTAASDPVEVSLPSLEDDTTPPTVTEPKPTRVSIYFSSMPGVAVFAADAESAVDRVEFYVEGELQRADAYPELHGWSDPEGEVYFSQVASKFHGTVAHVEVRAYDVFGNVTVSGAMMNIPTN